MLKGTKKTNTTNGGWLFWNRVLWSFSFLSGLSHAKDNHARYPAIFGPIQAEEEWPAIRGKSSVKHTSLEIC